MRVFKSAAEIIESYRVTGDQPAFNQLLRRTAGFTT